MGKIKYRNLEGDEIYLGKSRPFFLIATEGFGGVDNALTTQRVHDFDGAILIDKSLETRPLEIEGEIVRSTTKDIMNDRRELVKVFSPKLAGTLTYEYFDKVYQIDVEVLIAPEFPHTDNPLTQPFRLMFEALDPYWMDTTYYDSLIPLSTKENGFKFPFIITEQFVFATLKSGNIIEIDNNGDVEVGAEFRLKTYGETTNPRIYNILTQEYFGFKGTYPPGTEFCIVTRRGEKQVTKTFNDETVNAMGERMPDSTFLTLKKGLNYLQIQADVAVDAVFGELNFTPLVMGV